MRIFIFSMYCIQHCFICRPSDSTVSEDAAIEPRTVATSALAVRRSNPISFLCSNHSARSHPQLGWISSTTRLDLIQNSARSQCECCAKGNLSDWWGEEAGHRFQDHAQCLVQQFASFSLYNQTVNGRHRAPQAKQSNLRTSN
jgi:hypothetical protein